MTNIVPLRNTGGYTRMDNELYEALIGADLSGRELRVALAVHRQTAGYNVQEARIAASYIAEMANIHREDVSRIISELLRQRVVYRTGGSRSPMGIAPVSEWKIDSKNTRRNDKQKAPQCGVSTTSKVAFLPHNKDSKDNLVPSELVAAAAATDAETVAVAQEQEPTPVPVQPAPKAQDDRIPYAEIAKLYNTICGHVLPKCKSLTDKRRAAIRGCWNLTFGGKKVFRDMDFWEGYFNDAADHPFLTGQRTNWRADFDFLTRASAAVKILEGGYDR
ncbi:replication protein [Azotobacter vinelandii]